MTIITLSEDRLQTNSWQWQLQNAIRSVDKLSAALEIELPEVPVSFPLLVPLPFVDRMAKRDPLDPLLLQVLPRDEENHDVSGYRTDPLDEMDLDSGTKGLIQKYHGRVLIITTGACGVNCRYCFRRHFPYADYQPNQDDWISLVDHIRDDRSLNEVILSGGDPLAMKDSYLASLISSIEQIKHIDTIRLHTRMPVVIPQRICDELLDWVTASNKKLVFVLHVNHPNEIDDQVANSISRLRDANVTLLNQSVLLKNINDTAQTLTELSRRLFSIGVLPYYLHLFDPVSGAQHFDVAEETGLRLIKEITGKLPGYLVPRLAREVPGSDAKLTLRTNRLKLIRKGAIRAL